MTEPIDIDVENVHRLLTAQLVELTAATVERARLVRLSHQIEKLRWEIRRYGVEPVA